MQSTSELYKQIVDDENHNFETRVSIDGNILNDDEVRNVERDASGMSGIKPSVGAAIISNIRLTIKHPTFTIPKQARIVIEVRAYNDDSSSEWIKQGEYFIDTRRNVKGTEFDLLEIVALDAMAKADQDYPDTSHNWPYRDTLVVAEIASAIGVAVDPRTNQFLTAGYMIDLPIGYTMRETLEHIAAAYGGNFVISPENKLLFVPLYGLDPEITGNYLADESGNALVFGGEGWCILV